MINYWFLTLLMLGTSNLGKISGKVVDSETGDPLPGASVMVVNSTMGASADIDGFYSINRVPPGEYSVVVRMMGYANVTVKDVTVKRDELTKVDFSLKPEALQSKGVVVSAKRTRSTVAALLSSQKKEENITSGVSQEQISKSPDSRASDVLKRVTGLTVVSDKYVFVRGLSERYSNTRLNKSELSSPEPDKRVVPFDIFPANLLDDVVISKSFDPSQPGDFAGGSIHLTTREFTGGLVGKVSTSFGYNSLTTFKDFHTYRGGNLDFLGFDDGTRALPSIVKEAADEQKIVEGGMFGGGFSAQKIEEFGEAFSNVWSPSITSAPVNQSFSISGGNEFTLLNRPLGIISSITYKNSHSFREEEKAYYVMGANGLEARHSYDSLKTSKFSAQLGGILNMSYKVSPYHKLGLKTTYTRTAEDNVVTYAMLPNRDHNLDEKGIRLRWVERSILSTELSGEHKISPFDSKVIWTANYSFAGRDEPDTREVLYESEIGKDSFRLADESNSGSRFFSYMQDHNIDGGIDWEIPIKNLTAIKSKMKTGLSFVYKDREIDSRRFRFKPEDFNDVNIYQPAESIFVDENIGEEGFQLSEDTRPTDNYEASQFIYAGYLSFNIPVSPVLRFAGGVRVENSRQTVETFDLFNPEEKYIGEVNNLDILPSLNVVYRLAENMNLKSGISQTVSRPSFRELSKFEFTDIGGHAVYGNPDLKRTLIRNYDLRWEWYPDFTEYVTVATFYKDFKNPIEKTLEDRTEPVSTWENAKSASNYGFEIELRKNLGFISGILSDFSVSGNYSYIYSHVVLEEEGADRTTERALQGQSPYVINLNLEYDNESLGTEASILYNVSGRRISSVGIATTPDIYEEPFYKFDMTFSQKIIEGMKLKFSAENILDSEVKYTQGDMVQRYYKNGRSYSLGISYSI